jgi:uncharacterized protein DUF2846
MWKSVLALLLLAGCAQIPPSAEDIQAKRFEPVPDKAVIYIVRDHVGPQMDDTLWLGESEMITTHTGTYYRWVVAPGKHRISGFGVSTTSLVLTVEAGKIYFVHHGVHGTDRSGVLMRFLEQYDEQTGRERVAQASLL